MSLGMQRDELIGSERVQTVCVAGLIHELDLECVVGKNLDHGTNLAGNKAHLGQVADECHGIEQMNVGCSRHVEVSIG